AQPDSVGVGAAFRNVERVGGNDDELRVVFNFRGGDGDIGQAGGGDGEGSLTIDGIEVLGRDNADDLRCVPVIGGERKAGAAVHRQVGIAVGADGRDDDIVRGLGVETDGEEVGRPFGHEDRVRRNDDELRVVFDLAGGDGEIGQAGGRDGQVGLAVDRIEV